MAQSHGGVSPDATSSAEPMPVEVRSRFDGEWCRGFVLEEADVREDGTEWFKLRRLSDGRLLPDWFPAQDVMSERRPG